MHSPSEQRRKRGQFKNSRSYEAVRRAILDEHPELEVLGVQVTSSSFSRPPSGIVEFETPENKHASILGNLEGQTASNVRGEVTEYNEGGETVAIHTYRYDHDTGEVIQDTIDEVFDEIRENE